MATCPKCHLPNPDGTDACIWCGQHRFGAGEPAAEAVASGTTAGPASPEPAALAPDLPPALAEPILTPATSPPDYKPLPSHVHLLFARPTPPPADGLAAPTPNPGAPPTHAGTYLTGVPGSAPVLVVPAPAPATPTEPDTPPPAPLRPRLVVLRGQKINTEYPVYEGRNVIGRFADRPVDIDLVAQEPEGQIWSSRQHAAITLDQSLLLVEDLNSLNGTWVNGARLHPGQQKVLRPGDVIQIGTVQLKLLVS